MPPKTSSCDFNGISAVYAPEAEQGRTKESVRARLRTIVNGKIRLLDKPDGWSDWDPEQLAEIKTAFFSNSDMATAACSTICLTKDLKGQSFSP